MAYEKFTPRRGGHGGTFFGPYVTINKGGMTFNRHVTEMIGDGFKYVAFYFDKEISKIGLWFWKDACPGSYTLIWQKNHEAFTANARSFFQTYGIHEKIKKCNARHFPLETDEENKKNNDFYCVHLKPPKEKPVIVT